MKGTATTTDPNTKKLTSEEQWLKDFGLTTKKEIEDNKQKGTVISIPTNGNGVIEGPENAGLSSAAKWSITLVLIFVIIPCLASILLLLVGKL